MLWIDLKCNLVVAFPPPVNSFVLIVARLGSGLRFSVSFSLHFLFFDFGIKTGFSVLNFSLTLKCLN